MAQLLEAAAGSPEEILRRLDLPLPPPRPADRRGLHRVGEMVYTAGVLPWWGDELRGAGLVGADLSVRQASLAARLCVHNAVSLLRAELGSLDRVAQVARLTVMVQPAAGFESLSRVADGASSALFEIFGSRGRHRREVLAGADLPHGASVQVALVVRLG